MHHHHTLAASESGTVVLDIGGDVGALVLYVTAADHGREIEISRTGTPGPRIHAAVRERLLENGSIHCVVYPDLPAGTYTVWADGTTPGATVTVTGSEIAELDWTTR